MAAARNAVYIFLSLLLGGTLLGMWIKMLAEGDAPWTSWRRSFDVAGLYIDLYVFLLLNVFLVPTFIAVARRTKHLLRGTPSPPGLLAVSRLFTAMSLAALLVVTVRYQLWNQLLPAGAAEKPKPPSDERIEYPALPLPAPKPLAWTLTPLDGPPIEITSLRGKTVFLNFWGTWCYYCILELPNIQNLRAHFKDNPNIVFLAVTEEDAETITQWLATDGADYQDLPIYRTTEAIPDEYAVRGYPTTYIIAPDGRTAFRHSGAVAWDGEKTKDFLKRLSETPADAGAGG